MPFDAIQSRPFMRHGTAELAVLVDSGTADLRAILAELSHRERGAARKLAARVSAMLQDGPAPVVMPPAEVVPCIHGEVAPEAREIVVSVERVTSTTAKPTRKAKGEKRPGDVGWKPPSLETLIKRSGNPALIWSPEIAGAFGNPIKAARWEALKAEGWQHVADRDGYQILAHGDARLRLGHHGMIYLGDATWVQLARDERDRLTAAGLPMLERLAHIAACETALKDALASRGIVLRMLRESRKGSPYYSRENARTRLRELAKQIRKARADLEAARAS